MNYYNEFDPFAAAWLRNLISAGLIPPGDVDERSIKEVTADDVRGYTQCHFFCGIAGWCEALRLAGVPATVPLWTGSCPCQPFSNAGKRKGADDERHLWPDFFRLIAQCKPPIVFGEQVSGAGVLGPSTTPAKMQEVLDREAVFGVLRELQGQSSVDMQRLRESNGAQSQEEEFGSRFSVSKEVEGYASWPCSCERGKAQGESEGHAMHDRSERHSDQDRRRSMRTDGNSVRSVHSESLERTIAGSDQFGNWLHTREHASGSLCPKCGGQYLGRESAFADCVGDHGTPKTAIQCFVDLLGGKAQEESGWPWFSGVRLDLERAGYAVRACVLPASSVGAPHIRQRLWWVAHSEHGRSAIEEPRAEPWCESGGVAIRLADTNLAIASEGREQRSGQLVRAGSDEVVGDAIEGPCTYCGEPNHWRPDCPVIRLEHAASNRRIKRWPESERRSAASGCGDCLWSAFELVPCRDGKARRIEPGLAPLAHGVPNRVGRLRGYGNAIVPACAAEFIKAFFGINRELGE